MITTIDRYKWLRIDGESFKVPAGEFFGLRWFVNPTMPPNTAEFRDSTGQLLGRIVNLADAETDSK